ncbi:AMP-binding protein [Virgibacillus alimentarius]|uniref:Long-chain acyl-CoA synthetase n=1 Tax=Virgibacillus alimentarius TaxID=698769 RepID=A0ABS4SE64_9BACI|nr:AMP-binding protein [Virgibacillus alimentarius]MBP2258667.1 long-chain acyl-CoA synthetase [Virgibacillus alimentarius]
MKSVLKKSWPKEISEELNYRLGEKPLHEYVMQNAVDKPDQPSFVFYGNEITWKELNDQTKRFAQFLKNQGVVKGSRVAVFMQNCPQYVIGHYAIQMLGAVVIPLNPMYKESELEYFVNEAEIEVIITGQELYEQLKDIREELSSLSLVITTNYADFLPENSILPLPEELKMIKQRFPDTLDMTDGISQCGPVHATENVDLWNDVSLMVFTSGTTGRPKAAMLTFGNALFKTAAGAQGYKMESQDVTLASAPLCHIAGMLMGLNIPVYSGHECVLLTRFEPETAIQAIERHKVNKIYTIAPMNAAILHHPDIEDRDLSSLEINMATSFGMAVDQKMAGAWEKLTDGCLLFEASYGLSETHTLDTMMPIDGVKHGTCGIATFETEIRIVDLDTGEDLSPGEQGEVAIKSPGVFKGYLNRPEATNRTLKDGWVFTGDIGVIDEQGYFYFEGRVKEMIKSSGFSVFPEDVEALLSEHPAIYQSAVIGVPAEGKGEQIKAFIVLDPDYKNKVTENDLIQWAKEKMAAYKYPRKIEFLDQLPVTSSGKVLRRLLKEE